jgi:hypothetical protein
MLTVIFIGAIVLLAIAGVFISMEAKRRPKGVPSSAAVPADDRAKVARATPDND